MSKNDQYFPHDYNAYNDLKVVSFISEFGLAGYGFYWIVIERLHKEESCQLPKKEYIYKALAKQMLTSVEQIKEYIQGAIDCELFIKNDEFIISERVLKNMKKRNDISEKRSEAGKISALKRTNVEQVLTSVEQNPTKERKRKEIKELKEKDKKEIPTSEEVRSLFVGYLSILNITDIDEEKLNAQLRLFIRYYIGDEDQKGKWQLQKTKFIPKTCVKNWIDKNINAYKPYKKTDIEILTFNTFDQVFERLYKDFKGQANVYECEQFLRNEDQNGKLDIGLDGIYKYGAKLCKGKYKLNEKFKSNEPRYGLQV